MYSGEGRVIVFEHGWPWRQVGDWGRPHPQLPFLHSHSHTSSRFLRSCSRNLNGMLDMWRRLGPELEGDSSLGPGNDDDVADDDNAVDDADDDGWGCCEHGTACCCCCCWLLPSSARSAIQYRHHQHLNETIPKHALIFLFLLHSLLLPRLHLLFHHL